MRANNAFSLIQTCFFRNVHSRSQLLEVPGDPRRQFRRFLVQPLQVDVNGPQRLLEIKTLLLLL